MASIKKSFLSNLIGRDVYDELKRYALIIITIGTCVLAVLLLLSFFFHWSFISRLINLTTGTSLLFIIYIASLIIVLDKEVDVDVPDQHYIVKDDFKESKAYKLTIVRGVLLIVIGILAVYFSNRYRKQYAFSCSTFLVDTTTGVYHYDWNDDCEAAAEAEDLIEMKGYEFQGENYTLCDLCKEYAEEIEDTIIEERYSK